MTKKPKYPREQLTAYHDAGHAVVAHFCRYAPAIRKVTIIPANEAHGQVAPVHESIFNPEIDADLRTIVDRITVLLAGNESIKKLTGRYDSRGAFDDDDVAINLAMSPTGSGEEATAMLRWLRVRAQGLVRRHWACVRAVATELLERSTLSGRDVRQVIEQEIQRQIGRKGVKRSPAN